MTNKGSTLGKANSLDQLGAVPAALSRLDSLILKHAMVAANWPEGRRRERELRLIERAMRNVEKQVPDELEAILDA